VVPLVLPLMLEPVPLEAPLVCELVSLLSARTLLDAIEATRAASTHVFVMSFMILAPC
jgi:hypothetical protein